MTFQIADCRLQIFLTLLFIFTLHCPLSVAGEKWPGVDESVIEKVAAEHGRKPAEPLINTDRGDLLLFVFLLAGAAGGFIAGYCWKSILDKKNPK